MPNTGRMNYLLEVKSVFPFYDYSGGLNASLGFIPYFCILGLQSPTDFRTSEAHDYSSFLQESLQSYAGYLKGKGGLC